MRYRYEYKLELFVRDPSGISFEESFIDICNVQGMGRVGE